MLWRTVLWALQVLHACRNLYLKPIAYNGLNLYYSSIDSHAGGNASFTLCLVLSSTRQILTFAAPLVYMGFAPLPVMEDVIEKMLCIHTQDQMWSIQVSQGILISLFVSLIPSS